MIQGEGAKRGGEGPLSDFFDADVNHSISDVRRPVDNRVVCVLSRVVERFVVVVAERKEWQR
jgi:hypothetical protein